MNNPNKGQRFHRWHFYVALLCAVATVVSIVKEAPLWATAFAALIGLLNLAFYLFVDPKHYD